MFDKVLALEAAQYMRVSALAVWVFDFLQTVPGEIRLYIKQREQRRSSAGSILFVLVRYLSTAAMVTNSVGYFGDFSAESCNSYAHVPPAVKILAAWASHAVFFWRTWAISGRKRWVVTTLLALLVPVVALEVLGNVFITPLSIEGNCFSSAQKGRPYAWVFYLGGMVYDVVVAGISSFFLLGIHMGGCVLSSNFSFTRTLFEDGLFYVFVATFINLLNVIFFNLPQPEVQAMFVPLGIALVGIASSRMILNLQDPHRNGSSFRTSSRGYRDDRSPAAGRVNTIGGSPGPNSFAYSKSRSRHRKTVADAESAMELGVRVQVEVEVVEEDGPSPLHSLPSQGKVSSHETASNKSEISLQKGIM